MRQNRPKAGTKPESGTKPKHGLGFPSGVRAGVRATARAAGVSPSHVSYIFSGKRKPSLGVARRIAEACGMSLQELVDSMDVDAARGRLGRS